MSLARRLALTACCFLGITLGGAQAQPGGARSGPDAERIAARYRQMLEKNPAEGLALDRLWNLALESGQSGQLLEHYRAAAAAAGEGARFANAMIYGHLLRKSGESDQARAAYELASSLDPASPLPHTALAALHSDRSQPREAAAALEKAGSLLAEGDTRRAELLLKLANAWLAANEPAKAADALEKTSAANPRDLSLRERLAHIYESNGLAEKALPHWQNIAAHAEPARQAEALENIARIEAAAGRADAAIDALERALALTAPGNWMRGELQARMIRLHQRFHRTGELEARWKKAVEENPRDLGGYLQLIDFYDRTADNAQQLVWLEKLCALAPKNAGCKLRLARLLGESGETDRAATVLDELLAAQPGNADLVFERAGIDLRRNNVPAARARVEALLARSPQDDTLVARAIEWYGTNRMLAAVEPHLKADAERGDPGILALANWYFSQKRRDEARRTLERLVKPGAPAAERAAAYGQIATMLKDQGETEPAIEAGRRAVELQPESVERRMALADLLLVGQRVEEARAEAERAVALAVSEEERAVADAKLFSIFGASAPAQASVLEPPGKAFPTRGPLPRGTGSGPARFGASSPLPEPANAALERFISGLVEEAAETGSADAFLRAARWQLWCNRNESALALSRRALDLAPASVPAHELAIKAAMAAGSKPEAIELLRKLCVLDPQNQSGYARQIGHLQHESGMVEEALATFQSTAAARPGDPEALTDLALAQQAAGRWEDALATWQRAFDASPPAKKKSLTQPLLRVLERLEKLRPAAELLLAATDAQTEESARDSALQDLIAFCRRTDQTAWLAKEFAKRHKARPDDNFSATAYARVLKADGRAAEAYDVLANAAYTLRDEPAALAELVSEAEALGNLAAAMEFQRRLVALTPKSSSAALEKLADLQESALEFDRAQATWRRIAQLFPRDAVMQERAGDFFRRMGADGPAREALRAVCTLAPDHTRALLSLARLAREAGDREEAIGAYEGILRHARAEKVKPGEPLRLPGISPGKMPGRIEPPRLHLSTLGARGPAPRIDVGSPVVRASGSAAPGSHPEPPTDAELRILAIRGIGEMLAASRDEAALRKWWTRWAEPHPGEHPETEAFWAFHSSGANDRALAALRALLDRQPDNAETKGAFALLALRMREYGALRKWALDSARTGGDREILLAAFQQHLETEGEKLDPQLVPKFFSEPFTVRSLLWQAAVKLAGANRLEAAAGLGQRAIELSPSLRGSYAVEVARWHLCLGEKTKAQAVLRSVLDEGADSFDQPFCEALRMHYLLLPEAQRAQFVENFERRLDRDRAREPLRAAIAMTILHGLGGNARAAEAELSRLLELRALTTRSLDSLGDSSNRFWTFVLTAGMQLQEWKLNDLATFFWERALADPASIHLGGEQATTVAREVRVRLFASRLLRAGSFEAEVMLHDHIRTTPPEDVQILASILENNGWHAPAVRVYRELWLRNRQNHGLLRSLLNACRVAGDVETTQLALTTFEGALLPMLRHEGSLLLIDQLERQGDGAMAERLMGELLAGAASKEPQVLDAAARFYERAGRVNRTEAMYRRLLGIDGSNINARLQLAALLQRLHRTEEAVALLAPTNANTPPPAGAGASASLGPADTEVAPRLAALYLDAGRTAPAFAEARKLLRAGSNLSSIGELSERFANAGATDEAMRLLRAALSRSGESRVAFALRLRLTALLAGGHPGLARQELQRLRAAAAEAPDLEPALFETEETLAPKLGFDFEKRLREAWKDGEGSACAGVRLVELLHRLKQPEKAEKVAAAMTSRRDTGENALGQLAVHFKKNGRLELAAAAEAALCRGNRLSEQHAASYVRTLLALGRKDAAREELDQLALRRIFSRDLPARVAPLYAALGDHAKAREMFAAAVAGDPAVRDPEIYLGFSRFLRGLGESRPALHFLRIAFRNPQNREVGAIVEHYQAAGELARMDAELPSFRLSPGNLRAVRAALFALHAKGGRAPEALNVLRAHPDILPTDPVRAHLRPLAGSAADAFATVTAMLETAVSQSPSGDSAKIARDLAAILADRAERHLADGESELALASLTRANALAPEVFPVLDRLCRLLIERNEKGKAREAVERFLQGTTELSERQKAQGLLIALKE